MYCPRNILSKTLIIWNEFLLRLCRGLNIIISDSVKDFCQFVSTSKTKHFSIRDFIQTQLNSEYWLQSILDLCKLSWIVRSRNLAIELKLQSAMVNMGISIINCRSISFLTWCWSWFHFHNSWSMELNWMFQWSRWKKKDVSIIHTVFC